MTGRIGPEFGVRTPIPSWDANTHHTRKSVLSGA
jgi:hypothetical protein